MRRIILMLLLLIFSGCTPLIQVNTIGYLDTSIGTPTLSKNDKFVVIGNMDAKNKILDNSIKNKIGLGLERNGYLIVDESIAKYFIKYSYGIDSGQNVTQTVPIYNSYTGTTQIQTVANYMYERIFKLEVFQDLSSDPLWIGETKSRGTTGNIIDVLDYLIVANLEQFGVNSKRSIQKNIKMNDKYTKILQNDWQSNSGVKNKDKEIVTETKSNFSHKDSD